MAITITKLVHSCLLVESPAGRTLIDPGTFTWNDDRLDLDLFEGIDRVLVTHEHADHVSVDLVKAVVERSPEAVVETIPAVQALLAEAGVAAGVEGTPRFTAPHEDLAWGPGPPNTGYHVDGALSHAGDSHTFSETMPVLAVALAAPWGALTQAVAPIRRVRPSVVVPIHDWFLTEPGRDFWYGLAKRALEPEEIAVSPIADFTTATFDA